MEGRGGGGGGRGGEGRGGEGEGGITALDAYIWLCVHWYMLEVCVCVCVCVCVPVCLHCSGGQTIQHKLSISEEREGGREGGRGLKQLDYRARFTFSLVCGRTCARRVCSATRPVKGAAKSLHQTKHRSNKSILLKLKGH